jgi:CarboxypepD_reg-like domain
MFKVAVVFIILLPFGCFAQFAISGKILNHADKKPIANASVFLNNASVGSKTAENGTFILRNAKPGKYELVVSIIGFEAYNQTITVSAGNITLPDIEIAPKTIVLEEVSIKSKVDPHRDRNYDWFQTEFLGNSYLPGNCKILNPEIIDLDYDEATNTLTGSSNDFIEIQNDALGYKIKYLLTNFTLNNKDRNAKTIHYEGSALFENMKGTPSQERRWQKRRQEVYEGSAMHFLRSALNDRIAEEGFRVLQLVSNPDPQKAQSTKMIQTLMSFPLKKDEIVKPTDQEGIYALGCDYDALHITYNKNHHFRSKAQLAHLEDPSNTETTILSFIKPYVFFDKNGGIVDPNSLSFTGAWGRNRVASLLPVDYEQPNEENKFDNTILKAITSVQPGPLKDSLLKITTTADSLTKNYPAEKIYMQFDKLYYAVGDTIWFKAYLFNSTTLLFSAKSGLIHLDITSDSGKLIKQYIMPVNNGLSWGNISLASTDFKTGTYTLRAYTNWMRNFDGEGFYYRQFYIASPEENNWLINSQASASNENGKYQVNSKLQFTDINKMPVVNKPMQLKVYAETKNWYKQEVRTDENGSLDVNFILPEKSSNPVIVVQSNQTNQKAVVPLNLNREYKADIQFLPEGGSLVADLPANIGFKAIGEDSKFINISGIITDDKQQQVAVFESLHNGMGSFKLPVKNGGRYTAKVTFPGGAVKEYPLPPIKNSGTILQIKNAMESDSVEVSVAATNDFIQSSHSYFLFGKARGFICYAAIVDFHDNNTIRRKIAKSLFPSGITHFILTTVTGEPLNERLVFIDHHDNLNVQIKTDRPDYAARDSIDLHIKVTDNEGNPVAGNFSLAVTDDDQVKTDSLNNENITTHLLLSSDLKGYVEKPGYYFEQNAIVWQALDNLLLMQGWVSYDLQTDKQHPQYVAEYEFSVKGQVVNAFNMPVKATHVQLLSKSPLLVNDTVTNKEGRFTFNNFPRIDTPAFVLRAVNRSGKSFNVGIKMDETPPPIFNAIYPATMPWYVNSDATMINYTKTRDSISKQQDYLVGGHHLKEVRILARKIVKGSQNLNGPGNADLVLDEKDMEKAGKKTWAQLFKENIKGFREGTIFKKFDYFLIEDKIVVIIVDGILLDDEEIVQYQALRSGLITFQDYLNNKMYYIKSHSAEDIKGMEVMSSFKYGFKYGVRFGFSAFDYAVIEITTRSGRGPVTDNTPGMYLYKPLAISWPKQFYKPRYAVNDTTKHLLDLRSTIDWEPNVITDKNGDASISFYAADSPSAYTVIIEGSDGNGNIGYKLQKIIVKKQKTGIKL